MWPYIEAESVIAIIDASDSKRPRSLRQISVPKGILCGPNLELSPDGRLVAVGSGRQVEVFSTDSGDRLQSLSCPDGVKSLAWATDAKWIAAGCVGGKVRLFRTDDWQATATFEGDSRHVMAIDINPEGTTIATAGTDGVVRQWRVPDGTPIGPRIRDNRQLAGQS